MAYGRFITPWIYQAYLEPQTATAWLEPDGELVVMSSTQAPFATRDTLAQLFGLPVERVTAEVVKRKPSYEIARALSVERANPARVEPRCPHFGVCGGCTLQHADEALQLAAKQRAVRADEDVLHEIFRFRIRRVRKENAMDHARAAFIEQAKSRAVARLRGADQRGFIGLRLVSQQQIVLLEGSLPEHRFDVIF